MNEDKTKNITMLEQALYYLEERGWSVIPIGKDKKPLIKWTKYQFEKATKEEVISWFTNNPEANVGIVTGNISNLTVVDIDPRHNGTDEDFRAIQTVKSATGGGGWHYFFKYKNGIQNHANIKEGIDIRGEGGYVIAPPSLHASGKRYEWINNPNDTSIAELPIILEEMLVNSERQNNLNNKNRDNNLLTGVAEGGRNDSAASVIGKWLKRYPQDEWESDVWPMTQLWNQVNQPPLPLDELRTTFDSITNKELTNKDNSEENSGKRTVSDKLVDLTLASNALLYMDQAGEPHVTFPEKPIIGYPIKGSIFRRWLSGKYWQETNRGISGDTFLQTVNSLEAKAFSEGNTNTLFNRIARLGNTIYYDLGDDNRVVKITDKGWEITNDCELKFRRFNHQLPQVDPLPNGNINNVLRFLNLKTETDKLLYITYLVTVFFPDIPRVILINIGDQGAAKSTALRIARSLIDPSVAELLSPPTDIGELAQASNHHYCLYLDNLSYLKDDLSDALCRLATGIGFTKRKLFTNDEDILFNQKAAIGITGINLVAQRPDLLDRCLILSFERIPEDKRIDEEDFWRNFNEEKPYILGAIFDTLSKILRLIPTFKLPRKPRMADYAKYATAGAISLGKTADEFLDVFSENISRQNQAAIESSPTAQSILQFMSERDEWNGSSSDLHKELKLIVEKLNLQIGGSDGFPKPSSWLWRRIMQIRTNLLSLGINATKAESDRGSFITLKKSIKESDIAATPASVTSSNGTMAAMAENSPKVEDMDEEEIRSIFGMEEA